MTMMTTTFLPVNECFHDLDKELTLIHCEVRFIAHTLARLRHRRHAALCFSCTQLLYQQATTVIQGSFSGTSRAMWKKLFRSPRKSDRRRDVESAPSTPATEASPNATVEAYSEPITPTNAATRSLTYFPYTPRSVSP